MEAVVPRCRDPGRQLGEGVTRHDPIEIGVAERAHGVDIGPDEDVGSGLRTLEHGGERLALGVRTIGRPRLLHGGQLSHGWGRP